MRAAYRLPSTSPCPLPENNGGKCLVVQTVVRLIPFGKVESVAADE